jgi:hypothetical protein
VQDAVKHKHVVDHGVCLLLTGSLGGGSHVR